jgi:ATP-dependent Zn protease
VDDAIDLLLAEERERARKMVADHEPLLRSLCELLLEKKVLDATALTTLRPSGAVTQVERG